jgi:2-dehydropantoate 2-reductase
MKVCVVGLGAIGGFVAHRIAASGRPVAALARGATLEAVRRDGLVLRDAADPERGRAVRIEASDSAAALGAQDLVVLAVKTTALPSVAASIGPLLGPGTAVLSAMNGVPWWFFHGLGERWRGLRLETTDPGGALAAAIPAERVIGCVVHMSASAPAPGVVRHGMGERFIVGEPGGAASPRLERVAALLSAAGLQVETSPRIERDVWLKLWGNMTMNPVSVLTSATLAAMLEDDLVRAFVSRAMLEAAAIGERIGLPIGMTPDERHAVTRKLGHVRTSMLQDAEAGRPLELDALVGAVAELGRRLVVDTPNIDALLGLTRLHARTKGLLPA